MMKIGEPLKAAAKKAKDIARDASGLAEDMQGKAKERIAIHAVDKQREKARKAAVSELKDAIDDLNGFLSIPSSVSDNVNKITLDMIEDARTLKELVYKMTPVSLAPVLGEYCEKWNNADLFESDADNIAQQELDKKEGIRRRYAFVRRCNRAMEVLSEQAMSETQDQSDF